MKVICSDCGWIGDEDLCQEFEGDLAVGDVVPVGTCPAPGAPVDEDSEDCTICGAVCHYVPNPRSAGVLIGLSYDDWRCVLGYLTGQDDIAWKIHDQIHSQLMPETHMAKELRESK